MDWRRLSYASVAMADRTEWKGARARVGRGGGGSEEIHYSISSPVPVMHTWRLCCEPSSRCQAISPTWGTDPCSPSSLFYGNIFAVPILMVQIRLSIGPVGLTHKLPLSLSLSLPFSTLVLFVRLWQQLLLPPSRGCHLARTQSGIKRTAEEARSVPRDSPPPPPVRMWAIKANTRRLL